MTDVIHIRSESNLIEVESFGLVTAESIESSISEVIRIYSESGISKILVNTTAQKMMPEHKDIFRIFRHFPQELRLALLVNKEQETLGNIQFAETTAYHRLPHVVVFYDRDKALEWLEK